MIRKPKNRTSKRHSSSRYLSVEWRCRAGFLFILLSGLVSLSACGGSSNSSDPPGQLSGNWQVTGMALDSALEGGIQGGFLQQNKGSIVGQFVYSFGLISQPGTFCNSGTATITGTVSGQSVNLTLVAGVQTYTVKATLSSDGSTMMGTYDSTDGQGCGTAQTGLVWTAVLIPPLQGAVQGSFHSTGLGVNTTLGGQDFAVTGVLAQGPNTGASSATITGTLSFQGYPCFASASVNGQITGNSVVLQVIAPNGLNAGSIGAPSNNGILSPAVFSSSSGGGYVLRGTNAYGISTSKCPGRNIPGDLGNVCLALGVNKGTQGDPTQFSNQACTEPITLTPGSLSFPPQFLATAPTSQSFTVTNTDPSGGTVNGLTIHFQSVGGSPDFPNSDFSGTPNFSEQDNCANPAGSSFSLGPQQSCTITVIFSPQQSCAWIPTTVPPSRCPPFVSTSVPSPPALTARVTVMSQTSPDGNTNFQVPVTGIGLSAIQPSTPELDFSSESLNGPGSQPQSVTFTNQSNSPVQILPAANPNPCGQAGVPVFFPHPAAPGMVPGIQAVSQIGVNPPSIDYFCDIDPVSGMASFPITSDTCTGVRLDPLQSCTVAVRFTPQPGTGQISPNYTFYLQLNTLDCNPPISTSDCEIDSGRFPVALAANPPSPLRMSPSAGLEFGIQAKGQISVTPLKLTLFNDPTFPDVKNPNAQNVSITGILTKGDYSEVDDCLGQTLAPSSSCSLSISFTPQIVGFDQGTITITYNNGLVQTIFLRGTGQ